MDSFLHEFTRWEWWAIIGFVLIVMEVFIPGAVFLWPAMAGLTLAVIAALFEPGWQTNLILFSILSIAFALLGRSAYLRMREKSDHPQLNQRGQQLIGRFCEVVETTSLERGRVKLGDSTWLARCAPGTKVIPVGEHVQVIAVEGTTLIISQPTSSSSL